MCSKERYYEEYVVLLRTETNGGAGSTGNSVISLETRHSVAVRIARL
jgi:hypothetical protein